MSLRAVSFKQTQFGKRIGGWDGGQKSKAQILHGFALYAKRTRSIVQPHTEMSHRSSNLFSATEVAETIGTDLETINEWLEVGAIDRTVFGGGRFSKYELQRAALTFEMVKLGLAPSRARDVVWEMEYDLQQIWAATVSNHYKAYAILIPNKQDKWLVFWCWTASKEEIEPPAPGHIILPISDILARVTNETEQARQHLSIRHRP
jgi:hypothetical protein